MDKLEKIIATIMKECEKDGEPVTYEEAKEMAEMELKANKNCKRYEQTTKPRKKVERERKVDNDKKFLLQELYNKLEGIENVSLKEVKTETEIKFDYVGNSYTLKLTKHRKPKN